MRLEEAAMIVAAIARRWRETSEKDDSGLISRDHVNQIISMTETTARNLVKLAASQLPDEWADERRTNPEEVERFIRSNKARLDEELEGVLTSHCDS